MSLISHFLLLLIDENNRVVKDRNRDVELMRMAILNPTLRSKDIKLMLSEEEVRVITAHFQSNVTQIMELVGNESSKIEKLVRNSTLFEIKRVGTGNYTFIYITSSFNSNFY